MHKYLGRLGLGPQPHPKQKITQEQMYRGGIEPLEAFLERTGLKQSHRKTRVAPAKMAAVAGPLPTVSSVVVTTVEAAPTVTATAATGEAPMVSFEGGSLGCGGGAGGGPMSPPSEPPPPEPPPPENVKQRKKKGDSGSSSRQAKVTAATIAAVKPGGGSYPSGRDSKLLNETNKNPPIVLDYQNKVDTEAGVEAAAEASSSSGKGNNKKKQGKKKESSSSSSSSGSSSRQATDAAATFAAVKPGGGPCPSGHDSKILNKTNKNPPIVLDHQNKVDTEANVDAAAKASSSSSSGNGKSSSSKKNEKKRQRKKEKLARARAATEASVIAAATARGAPFRKLLTEFMSDAKADHVWQAAAGKVCAYEEIEPFSESLTGRLMPVRTALLKFLPVGTVQKLLTPQLWGPKWLMLEVVHSLLGGASVEERELRLAEVDALWTGWNSGTAEVPAMPVPNHEAATPRPHDYVDVHAELATLMPETTATQLMTKWYGHAGMLTEASKLLRDNEELLEAIEDIWIARSDDDNYWAEDRYAAQEQGGWDSGEGESDYAFEPFS